MNQNKVIELNHPSSNTLNNLFKEKNTLMSIGEIMYSDDIWDFISLEPTSQPYQKRYDFTNIQSSEFKNIIKSFVLKDRMLFKRKFATVYQHFYRMRNFVNFLEENSIYSLKDCTSTLISEYMKNFEDCSVDYKHRVFTFTLLFFNEYDGLIDSSTLLLFKNELLKFSVEKEALRLNGSYGKTNNIPSKIIYTLNNICQRDVINSNLSFFERTAAAAILILMWSGMRRGELLYLKRDQLKESELITEKNQAGYTLKFLTYKTSPAKDGHETEIKAYENLVLAYKTLSKITYDLNPKNDFLFQNSKGGRLTPTTLYDYLNVYFYKHQKELQIEQLSLQEIKMLKKKHVPNDLKIKIINLGIKFESKEFYYIAPHQFRVAFANELYKNNVTIDTIKRHMNHLSPKMTELYLRNPEKIKQTLLYQANLNGDALVSRNIQYESDNIKKNIEAINDFLESNRFNIYKNLDSILDYFSNSLINESEIGYCTRAMINLCEYQNTLTSMENWYNNVPNIININSIESTIERFISKSKIVRQNAKILEKNPLYVRSYEIEKQSLNRYYTNKLLPEIELFYQIYNHTSTKEMIAQYPHLEGFLLNFKKKKKELEKWIKTNNF
ncbi:site-specific integrase [Streptococcus uberis]|uniref:site-specific integrase n=1 Tax=Streptococcus uberis TaxID=1349 RepID=UPI000DFF5DD3|nr:site-specific integrase [Streptococcus uberis]SUO88974.1 Site-specific recombinase XerD [Streptococcus uberis]